MGVTTEKKKKSTYKLTWAVQTCLVQGSTEYSSINPHFIEVIFNMNGFDLELPNAFSATMKIIILFSS